MSIIFFGTPEFAVPSLLSLLRVGEKVALVVTQPDRRKGRGHEPAPPPVKVVALKEGLRVIQPTTMKGDELVDTFASLKPEFIVTAAYGKILPRTVLHIPERGCINVHASILPKYRGAAPIAWAIIRGEKETGITTMLMDEGLDTGPILLQRSVAIEEEDTAGSLAEKLSLTGSSLLIETIVGMRDGSLKPQPQKGEPTFAPSLQKEDGLIIWSGEAADISRFIRGMQPWPAAYTHINGERITILKAEPLEGEGRPGAIYKAGKDGLIIGTGRGLLSVIELQPSGKRPMSASNFVSGRALKEGAISS